MLHQFVIQPSRTYFLLLLAMHLFAMGSVWLADILSWVQFALSLVVLFSLYYHSYFFVFLHSRQVCHSFSLNQQHVVINFRDGEVLSGELMHRTVVTPFCVLLCARMGEQGRIVRQLIFHDAMLRESFRELRVRLKFP